MAISKVRQVGRLTESTTNTATDWFGTNLVPNVAQQSGELMKWIFQIRVTSTTVVNILMDIDSDVVVYGLNGGSAVTAGGIYTESLLVPKECTAINIQHVTTNQDVSCVIGETRLFDSVE